jgi:integrase
MAAKRLTQRSVDALGATGAKRVRLWDGAIRGLAVTAHPSGVVTYSVRYRTADGRSRQLKLGDHPALALADARELAAERLLDVARGGDPLEAKAAARAARETDALTVEAAFGRYIDWRTSPNGTAPGVRSVRKRAAWRSRTEREVRRLLAKHIEGTPLGRMPLAAVTASHVEGLHSTLGAAAPVLANRLALDWFGGVLALAIVEGWHSGPNPCATIERFPETARERVLTDAELLRLGKALRQYGAKGGRALDVADAVRVALLTGLRLRNVEELAWGEIDVDARALALASTKTKALTLPIGPATVALLGRRAPASDGRVFPTLRRAVSQSGLRTLFNLAGIRDGEAWNTLRRTFTSRAVESGLDGITVDRLTGHAPRSIVARHYAVFRVDGYLRQAHERVEAGIAALLDGKALAPVVALPRREGVA